MGQFRLLDHVAAAEVERVHPEPLGHQVHHQFPADGLHLPRTPVCAPADRVREHRRRGPAQPGNAVRAREHRHQLRALGGRAAERVGAAVAQMVDLRPQDPPVGVHGHGHCETVHPGRVGGHQVLAAVLDPFDGPPQVAGREQQRHLVAARVHLLAERSAHVAHVDSHLVLADSEDAGRGERQLVGALGGRPQVEAPGVALPVSDQASGLHGHVALPLLVEGLGNDQVGRLEHSSQFGVGAGAGRAQVGAQFGVDEVGAGGGLLVVHDRCQGLVVDVY